MTQSPAPAKPARTDQDSENGVLGVSVVIPCFNEAEGVEQLVTSLERLANESEEHFEFEFIFVDDGSTDSTLEQLRRRVPEDWNCLFLRHDRNQGVASAIMTGMRRARRERACSIDCDCTYEVTELARMIPYLEDDNVDLVTASPYHPQGNVLNVSGWRLLLSRCASLLYRMVSRQKLYTYTSCFRVYRRPTLVRADLHYAGFVGIAEMLLWVDRNGGEIVEHPALLRTRSVGQSKMKIFRTIALHLGLLSRTLWTRLFQRTEHGLT